MAPDNARVACGWINVTRRGAQRSSMRRITHEGFIPSSAPGAAVRGACSKMKKIEKNLKIFAYG